MEYGNQLRLLVFPQASWNYHGPIGLLLAVGRSALLFRGIKGFEVYHPGVRALKESTKDVFKMWIPIDGNTGYPPERVYLVLWKGFDHGSSDGAW